ncbi:MAG: AraC family transcriptional regulator [Bacteroidota bacterium]
MRVRLHQRDFQDAMIEKNYPINFSSDDQGGITEACYNAAILGGVGSYKEVYMENIHIGYGDIFMRNLTEIAVEAEMESVELHFALAGETKGYESDTKQNFQFGYNQHNILYASYFKGKMFYPPKEGVKLFEINLKPGFFKSFLPPDNTLFKKFTKSIDEKRIGTLMPQHLPITPAMHLIINDIIHCDRVGFFKRMYLETKAKELLLLQLEQMSSLNHVHQLKLKKYEVERIHEVKKYLSEHVGNPMTLLQLAQHFGTNEYSLKTGFKEVFGTTVFKYWNSVKMSQARNMLLDESLTISQVSDKIGYKNPQHFTTAFKKCFGYPPSKLVNRRLPS